MTTDYNSVLDKKYLTQFLDLSNRLSPENLTCDGELPQSEVRRKYNKLTKEWKKLEKQVGRTVTEDEVWKVYFRKHEINGGFEDKISELLTVQVMRGD